LLGTAPAIRHGGASHGTTHRRATHRVSARPRAAIVIVIVGVISTRNTTTITTTSIITTNTTEPRESLPRVLDDGPVRKKLRPFSWHSP